MARRYGMRIRGLGGRIAEGEVGAAFTALELGPDRGGIVDVPAQLLKHAQDNTLGNGLFVGKPALAQTGGDVRECGFEGHNALTVRIHRRGVCQREPVGASPRLNADTPAGTPAPRSASAQATAGHVRPAVFSACWSAVGGKVWG